MSQSGGSCCTCGVTFDPAESPPLHHIAPTWLWATPFQQTDYSHSDPISVASALATLFELDPISHLNAHQQEVANYFKDADDLSLCFECAESLSRVYNGWQEFVHLLQQGSQVVKKLRHLRAAEAPVAKKRRPRKKSKPQTSPLPENEEDFDPDEILAGIKEEPLDHQEYSTPVSPVSPSVSKRSRRSKIQGQGAPEPESTQPEAKSKLTQELKEQIIQLHLNGKRQCEIYRMLEKSNVSRQNICNAIKRFKETGDVKDRARSGRPRCARTPAMVQSLKEEIGRNPRRSHKTLARAMNVSCASIKKALKDDIGVKTSSILQCSICRKTFFKEECLSLHLDYHKMAEEQGLGSIKVPKIRRRNPPKGIGLRWRKKQNQSGLCDALPIPTSSGGDGARECGTTSNEPYFRLIDTQFIQ